MRTPATIATLSASPPPIASDPSTVERHQLPSAQRVPQGRTSAGWWRHNTIIITTSTIHSTLSAIQPASDCSPLMRDLRPRDTQLLCCANTMPHNHLREAVYHGEDLLGTFRAHDTATDLRS